MRELGLFNLNTRALVQLSELPLAAQLVRLECPLNLEAAQALLGRRECFPALQAVRAGGTLEPELDAVFKKRRTRSPAKD